MSCAPRHPFPLYIEEVIRSVKYYFIVNPHSGKKDISAEIQRLVDCYFAENDPEAAYEVVVTQEAESKLHTVRGICEAAQGRPLRICACGGDGTLNGVASGVVGFENVEIGFYSAGSGNDFVKCFGSPEDYQSIESFVRGESVPVDIVAINGDYCLNLFSVGVDANVNYGIGKYRRLPFCGGSAAYNLSLLENLMRPMGKHLRITIDGAVHDGKFMLAAFGNGRVYGGGYYALPEARWDDGLLDIVLIDKISLTKVAGALGTYKKGEHMCNGEVIEKMRGFLHFYRGKHITIDSKKKFVLNNDGESTITNHVEAVIQSPGIRFICPKK